MKFKEWIRKYENDDSPFGDLAEDIARDEDFPDTDDRAKLVAHLEGKFACQEAIKTLRSALSRYNAYVKRQTNNKG